MGALFISLLIVTTASLSMWIPQHQHSVSPQTFNGAAETHANRMPEFKIPDQYNAGVQLGDLCI